MLLKREYLEMLEEVGDKELDINEFVKGEYEERERLIKNLLALELQDLIRPKDARNPRIFVLTEHGKKVLDIWKRLGKPQVERWLDSRIHMMLWTLWKTKSEAPKDWKTPLLERNFVNEEGKLRDEAIELLKVFEPGIRARKIRITRDLGGVLARIAPGPATTAALKNHPEDALDLLEAMDVIVYSAPDGGYYALTRLGRYLRMAIRELRPVAMEYILVNMKIIELVKKLIEGKELTDQEKFVLMNLGYMTVSEPTKAAKLLYKAIEELERGKYWETFTIGLTRVDQWVMKMIDYLWKKAETNPELKPTKSLIVDWFERHWKDIGMDEETRKELLFSDYTVGISLYRLEALELVDSYEEKSKLIYQLTDYGKQLLEVIEKGKIVEIPTYAIRPLVYADRGLPPFRSWIEEAAKEGLLGPGGMGRKGRKLAHLARVVKRRPLLTRMELLVLQKMLPSGQVQKIEELVKKFENPDEARAALYWLEMWGAVNFYDNDYVEITEIGENLKKALVATPPGIATPVHPHFLRVLEVIKELGSYEDIAEIVNRTRLTLGIVKDAIVVAREAKLLGKKDLTGEGELLLETVKEIQAHRETMAEE
ncbi:hypothetical protein EYM_06845 [Ignicoccus islandicus DSM 13165]|uniref:DUF505 domain-containing protein n=1 Tax=Ignicoccus islandicus DSM 13165 TaxID=940295 RepID=A0A0U3FS66_9CREN|nr:DUF505 domain-containing protein [Ignicoccus islandicus]ALU12727.1 hypothetical protein EYM_06845 [Ignicoccus islandicus DSM 13165]